MCLLFYGYIHQNHIKNQCRYGKVLLEYLSIQIIFLFLYILKIFLNHFISSI